MAKNIESATIKLRFSPAAGGLLALAGADYTAWVITTAEQPPAKPGERDPERVPAKRERAEGVLVLPPEVAGKLEQLLALKLSQTP